MTSTTLFSPSARPRVAEAWDAPLRAGHVVFGAGRLVELGQRVAALGARRALVVSDPGLVAAGHVEQATRSLAEAGVVAAVFSDVEPNPDEECIRRGVAAAREQDCDFLVGLGGGSCLDAAKGINFLLTNGGSLRDYVGFGRASAPMLPSAGVPCTAGTGSEAQSYAVLSQDGTHTKMALGDDKAFFRFVILDPLVVASAPIETAALAGFDAIAHAVESYVTRTGHRWSRLLAAEAWRLLDARYPAVAGGRAQNDDWEDMLWGAHLAGTAIEMSMLGAAHACSNPLTARFNTAHGAALAILLPHVVRANAEVAGPLYDALIGAPAGEGTVRLCARLEELRAAARLPARLREVGVAEKDLPELASLALEQWTLGHNPRPLDRTAVEDLYGAAL